MYSLKSNDVVHILNEAWKLKSSHLVKFSTDEKLIIGVEDFGAYNKNSNYQVVYIWEVESGRLAFQFVFFLNFQYFIYFINMNLQKLEPAYLDNIYLRWL